MKKEIIGYEPPRPYARASRVGDLIFLAGEGGTDPNTQKMADGIERQSELAFENIRSSLQSFGADLGDIVKMTVYLVNPEDRWPFTEVRKRYLSGPVPSTMVWVKRLADDNMIVEVDVIAVAP